MKAPSGLNSGGRALWADITRAHPDLDAAQLVQLTEACRAKDRLDEFDLIIHGKGVVELMRFRLQGDFWGENGRSVTVEVKFDGVIDKANTTANLLKQLLAALRLPDVDTGKRPQQRGARGSYKPQAPGAKGTVSSLDRARAAKSP